MKKIIVIAYYFAPLAGAGALRPLKLCKYLPAYGWSPYVLTVKNPDWHYAGDDQLLKEIPPRAKIFRTWMLRSVWLYRILNPLRMRRWDSFLKRYVIHPEDQIGWLPLAVLKAITLAKQDHIDAVFSTSGPLTSHLIAYVLFKRFGIPWIADFRDEWFENPDLPLPTPLHRHLHYNLEARIVRTASMVITAAPVFSHFLSKHCPRDPKFETITMGFDPDDYNYADSSYYRPNDKFTVTFSGLFYGSFRPDHLLRVVNILIEQERIQRDTVCLRFIGANSPRDLREPDPHGICEFTGFLPHKQALKLARQSDALLLLLSRERGKDVIPSKTFEYMALKKPVLAVVPDDGEVAKIVRETGIGLVADFDDVHQIEQAFCQMYQQWATGSLSIHPSAEAIKQYSYVNLTERIALLLDRITKNASEANS